jgi:hypothetical protein
MLRSHTAVALGRALFPLFALALEQPADFFDDKARDSYRSQVPMY